MCMRVNRVFEMLIGPKRNRRLEAPAGDLHRRMSIFFADQQLNGRV